MSQIIHTVGDVGTKFITTFVDQTGAVIDISAATLKQLKFFKPDGTLVTQSGTFVTDGTDGQLQYVSLAGDLDIAGDWQRSARAVIPTGEWETSVVGFEVKPQLGSPYAFADLTRLEAINLMLVSAGDAPVSGYLGSLEADVLLAMRILDAADRHIQLTGRTFNTEHEVDLVPVADEIVLDSDVVAVFPTYQSQDFAIRAGKLFNRDTNTFTFGSTETVTVVRKLPFSDLPAHAREFITARAVRQYAERVLREANPELRDEEREARVVFQSTEAAVLDARLGRNGPAYTVTTRRSPARWRYR